MRKFIACLIIAVMALSLSLTAAVTATADETTYTVTFTRGYVFINTITREESDHLFTGTRVPAMEVEKGGSFVFPENTVVFSNYVFKGWKCKYKDSDGDTVTKTYQPGDTFENVRSNITADAVWKRPPSPGIVQYGVAQFVKGDMNAEGTEFLSDMFKLGTEITLPECPFTRDGHKFAGWSTSDGVLYAAGADFKSTKLNPVLTAVWNKDGEAIVTHTVIYGGGEAGGEVKFELYKNKYFYVMENTFTRAGYHFTGWRSEDGTVHKPGEKLDVSSSATSTKLTAVWEKDAVSYNLTVSASAGGTVSPAGVSSHPENTTVTVTVTPDEGYSIASVMINGSAVTASRSINVQMTSDMLVNVTFEKEHDCNVSVTVKGNGKATLETPSTVKSGGMAVVDVIPDEGWKAQSVYINGENSIFTVENGKVTVTDINEDTVIEIRFAKEGAEPVSETESSGEVSEPIPVDGSTRKYILALIAAVILLVAGAIVVKIAK